MAQTVKARTGGSLVAESLEALGAEVAFGVPGIHALAIWDGLRTSSIRAIGLRTELSAGFAADGYARTSGRPAPLLLSTGPGALISLAALMEAASAHVPVVAVASQIPRELIGAGRGFLHELPDQKASFEPVVKWAARAEPPRRSQQLLAEAWRRALTPPSGPVFLEIPVDLLAGETEAPVGELDAAPGELPLPAADLLDEAADLLAGAASPVVWAGGGVLRSGGWDELRAVAERLGAPVATTYMGKGAFPDDHPLAVGSAATSGAFRELVGGADVLLAVGTELGAETTGQYALRLSGRLIHVDADPRRIGATYEALGLVGDAKAVLGALAERLPDAPREDGPVAGGLAQAPDRRRAQRPGPRHERGLLETIRAAPPPRRRHRLGHDHPGLLGSGALPRLRAADVPLPARLRDARLRVARGARRLARRARPPGARGRRRRRLQLRDRRARGGAPVRPRTPSSCSSTTAATGSCASTSATSSARPPPSTSSSPTSARWSRRSASPSSPCSRRSSARRSPRPSPRTARPSSTCRLPGDVGVTDWSGLVRPSLLGLEPYRPGASLEELKEAYGLDEIVKLNWNEGLEGPFPASRRQSSPSSSARGSTRRRPTPACARASPPGSARRRSGSSPATASRRSSPPSSHAFLEPGDAVVLTRPTYGLYATTCAAAGARVVEVPQPRPPPRRRRAGGGCPRARRAPRLALRPEQPDRRPRHAGRVGAPARRHPRSAAPSSSTRPTSSTSTPRLASTGCATSRRALPDRRHADVLEDLRARGAAPRVRGRRRAPRRARSTSSRSPSTSTAPPSPPGGRAWSARRWSTTAGWPTRPAASGLRSASARPAPAPYRRRRTSSSPTSASTTRPDGGARPPRVPRRAPEASSACRASSGSRPRPFPLMERVAAELADTLTQLPPRSTQSRPEAVRDGLRLQPAPRSLSSGAASTRTASTGRYTCTGVPCS